MKGAHGESIDTRRFDQPTQEDGPWLWRLGLECGHSMLWGPWEAPEHRRYIGQITICHLCPPVRNNPVAITSAVRIIVAVDRVPACEYREPSPSMSELRNDQMYG